jgi:hypothetical protein
MKVKELTEAQVFDWANAKDSIIKYADAKIDGKPFPGNYEPATYNDLAHILYTIITNTQFNRNNVGATKRLGFTDGEIKMLRGEAESLIKSMGLIDNGPWAEEKINSGKYPKQSTDKTYNYYVTIAKDKDNIILLYQNLTKLHDILNKISEEKKTPLAWKTCFKLLDVLIMHNDSLKVYYYDPALRGTIENAVKEWIRVSGVKTAPRTHVHGVDAKKTKDGKLSAGQLLARHAAIYYDAGIDKLKKTITPEKFYEWIKSTFEDIIRTTKF